MPSLFDSINPINTKFIENFIPKIATDNFNIGDTVPDFELPNSEGKRIKLNEFKGKPLLLVFTRIFTDKIFCPLCFPHLSNLKLDYNNFQKSGANILLVNSTSIEMTKQIKSEQGYQFEVLSDERWETFKLYGLGAALGAPLPAQFLLDAEQRIVFKYISGTDFTNQLPMHPDNADMIKLISDLNMSRL